jgi:hypothetical protein
MISNDLVAIAAYVSGFFAFPILNVFYPQGNALSGQDLPAWVGVGVSVNYGDTAANAKCLVELEGTVYSLHVKIKR